MKKKKKVFFFLPGSVGGAERMTVTIAKMLPLDEFIVKFVIVDKNRGDIENFIPHNYEVLFVPIKNIWMGTCLKVAKVLRTQKADFAFCSLGHLAPHILLGAKMVGGIKTIIRNDIHVSTTKWYRKLSEKITYPWAYVLISQQEEMRQDHIDTLGVDPNKIIVIHNPIDTKTIDAKTKDCESPFVLGVDNINYVCVGRFSPVKGQDILAKAFAIVAEKSKNAHLYFIGKYEDNEYFKFVNKIVDDASLSERVHFIGYDSNPYRWMKYSDCFVLPSRREGLPNALVEAMYLGKPVVASDCLPVISRMMDCGRNGYIVPVDNPQAMAKAMLNALQLTDLRMCYVPGNESDFVGLFR